LGCWVTSQIPSQWSAVWQCALRRKKHEHGKLTASAEERQYLVLDYNLDDDPTEEDEATKNSYIGHHIAVFAAIHHPKHCPGRHT
jgi:hypothetical protein